MVLVIELYWYICYGGQSFLTSVIQVTCQIVTVYSCNENKFDLKYTNHEIYSIKDLNEKVLHFHFTNGFVLHTFVLDISFQVTT